jgi:hypothetical protein
MKRLHYDERKQHKRAVFSLLAFALIFYSFSFITTSIVVIEDSESYVANVCTVLDGWFVFVSIMAFIDTILTMIVPFLLILTINILIVCKLMEIKLAERFCCFVKSKDSSSDKEKSSMITSEASGSTIRPPCSKLVLTKSERQRRNKAYSKTTKMLFILSATFLVLQTPIALNKAWYFFKNQKSNTPTIELQFNITSSNSSSNHTTTSSQMRQTSPNEEIIERLACYFYYLNFSLNFFLYTFNGPKFKNLLFKKISSQSIS